MLRTKVVAINAKRLATKSDAFDKDLPWINVDKAIRPRIVNNFLPTQLSLYNGGIVVRVSLNKRSIIFFQ